MTDEKEYEHLKNFKVQIEEIVKCPICQLIPRKIPITCCAKGHIICQDCRESIIRCPRLMTMMRIMKRRPKMTQRDQIPDYYWLVLGCQ